jgi:hypothetical protein
MKPPFRISKIGHKKNAAKKAAVQTKMVRASDCDIDAETGMDPSLAARAKAEVCSADHALLATPERAHGSDHPNC